MDRRANSRKDIEATAYIYYHGKRVSRPCVVTNISAGGAFLELDNHGLRRGRRIELVFPINLTKSVIKLRRISGIIVRISPSGAALIIRRQTVTTGTRAERSAGIKF